MPLPELPHVSKLEPADIEQVCLLNVELLKAGDLAGLLQRVLRASAEILKTDKAQIQLFYEQGQAVRTEAYLGISAAFVERLRTLPIAASVCGVSLANKERVVVQDIRTDPRFLDVAVSYTDFGVTAAQSTPLIRRDGQLLGTLSNYFTAQHKLAQREAKLLDVLAQLTVCLIERYQTEETLRQREMLLQTVTAATDVMLVQLDCDFNFVWVNRAYAETCRMAPEEMIGKNHFVLYPHAENEAIFRRVRDTGESVLYKDKPFVFPDQPERGITYWDWSLAALKDESKHVTGLVFSLRETTQYKNGELQLQHSEERFRRLVEVSSEMVWTTGADGVPREDSPSWRTFTGITPEEYFNDCRWLDCFHPDDRQRVAQVSKAACSSRSSYAVEARVRRADGIYRKVFARALPLFNSDSTVREWVGMSTDITELRDAEAALREGEARLKAIVETAMDGIVTIDEAGTVQSINPAIERMFEYTQEELIGRNINVLMPEPESQRHDDYLRLYRQTGERRVIGFVREVTGKRKNGSLFPIEISIGESVLPGKRFFTGIVRDVTARQEAQARIEQFAEDLERQVTRRTAELLETHDQLRALTTELNLTEQRERKQLASELHDHLQQLLVLGKMELGQGKRFALGLPGCEKSIQKVDDILSEALTYTRTLVAELSPPVLREHGLAAALKWLGQYMEKYNLAVTVAVPDDATVELLEDQLVLTFQSVRELLINSWKHAGTGRASISMRQCDSMLEIHVEDEGKGFDLSTATTENRPTGGMSSKFGLLAIRERMRAVGGSFQIESCPAQGTRATLTLPLAKVAAPHQLAGQTVQQVRVTQTPEPDKQKERFVRVLLVDDHAMMRQGLRSILAGYSDVQIVGEAANGADALCAVEQYRPAIVIMDVNMPKLGGIETTSCIKTSYPDISVIGLSMNAGKDNQELMLKAGAAMLITKEAAVEQLYGAIQEVMRSRPSEGGSEV
ncbi:MAG TPA: PAS domain S-box protein [Nitrospira sp.]|nr:PAS domain S-box protein [Nitrospira sp.]